jgi:hypothetical protein
MPEEKKDSENSIESRIRKFVINYVIENGAIIPKFGYCDYGISSRLDSKSKKSNGVFENESYRKD